MHEELNNFKPLTLFDFEQGKTSEGFPYMSAMVIELGYIIWFEQKQDGDFYSFAKTVRTGEITPLGKFRTVNLALQKCNEVLANTMRNRIHKRRQNSGVGGNFTTYGSFEF